MYILWIGEEGIQTDLILTPTSAGLKLIWPELHPFSTKLPSLSQRLPVSTNDFDLAKLKR